jgi:hypothetical protein
MSDEAPDLVRMMDDAQVELGVFGSRTDVLPGTVRPFRSMSNILQPDMSMHELYELNSVRQSLVGGLPFLTSPSPHATGFASPASDRHVASSHYVIFLHQDRVIACRPRHRELVLLAPTLFVVGVVPLRCATAHGHRRVVCPLPTGRYASLLELCSILSCLCLVTVVFSRGNPPRWSSSARPLVLLAAFLATARHSTLLVNVGHTLDNGLIKPLVVKTAHPGHRSISLPRPWLMPDSNSLGCHPPPASLSSTDVSLDPHPDVAARIEEPTPVKAVTPELQLAVVFEVLHHLDLAKKRRLLSAQELDLVEAACKAPIAESSTPPLLAHEVVILQSDLAVLPAPSPTVVDVLVVIVGSSTTPTVAFELQATGIGSPLSQSCLTLLLRRCV